ncbi:MAG: hypothetical protein HY438_01345 [DPANN group archaeon]|nr:hypothetical protein [DPANN group archaeon]
MGAGSGEAAGSGGVKPETEKFPLEKILTISAGDFAQTGSSAFLNHYVPKGVHLDKLYIFGEIDLNSEAATIKSDFVAKIPKGTEVIVDYRITMVPVGSDVFISQSGTALVIKSLA